MLHFSDDDFISCLHDLAAKPGSYKIHSFRDAAHENDFIAFGSVDEALRFRAGRFVCFGRPLAERVNAAMDV